jgi:hypothetical protein
MNTAEREFCMYWKGMAGTFTSKLIELFFAADTENTVKLSLGFPEIGEVVRRYRNESGYWQDLIERWNKEHPHSML